MLRDYNGCPEGGSCGARLGYPTSGEYAVPGGRKSDFERGSITWRSATDTTEVTAR